jgi:integrase
MAATVRKRKWTHKGVQSEAWTVRYYDLNGVRRRKTFATRKAADTFSSTTTLDIQKGVHIPDRESVTVEQAGQLWLATNEDDELEPSSIKRNRQHLEGHIVPRIGSKRLNQINVPEVRAFIDRLRGEGVSKALAKMIVTSLGSIFADAQERGLAAYNPIRDMRRNRGKKGKRKEDRKPPLKLGVDIPTMPEIRAILAKTTGRRRALLGVLAFAGLRGSELRGIRWQDVDLVNNTLTVWQRADQDGNIGEAKSGAAYRTIPMLPFVVHALKEWKLACPLHDTGKKGVDGEPVKELWLVFPSETGGVKSHQNIDKRDWQPLQVKAGVCVPKTGEDGKPVQARGPKGKPVHDDAGKPVPVMQARYSGLHPLRHFFASWCIARKDAGGLGLDPKTVQYRCGHSSITVTLDTYGHLWPADDETEQMAAAERAFLGA